MGISANHVGVMLHRAKKKLSCLMKEAGDKMNDDELKKLWQQQPLREPPSAAQLISAMQSKTNQLRRCLAGRDLRELLACAVPIIIFGFYCFSERAPLVRFGWKLVHTRRTTPPAPLGATLVASLRAELNSVRAQSRLLGSVLWWYLLLLWDEIKAVQPLRFLNVRSLWLVRESGEKTLMPWTSLEGHSELKAAVEKFAPASHPIRQYLPLLRRI